MSFDVDSFRKKFPQLESRIGDNQLVYFDNGASTLKHSRVAERINGYNRFEVSNVHRGAHSLSQKGTEHYEESRIKIKNFINASSEKEIIFTRGTTESINLIAQGLSQVLLRPGDEILISPFEHHSNIVPWQMVCKSMGCSLKIMDFDSVKGVKDFKNSLTDKTKVCAFLWLSNSFGNRLVVENIVEECKKRGIVTVIDAAQTPLTEKIDVTQLDCDFLTFSGHKMFAPYGIGALYGKAAWLEKLPPYQGGGSMIDRVTFEETTFADIPQKFEAGTPNISGAIGLGVAIDVVNEMGFIEQHQHVMHLRNLLKDGLNEMDFCNVYDFESSDYAGVISFNVKGAHPSDVGTLLDRYGIAVRTGHHCTQPLMKVLGIEGTVRVSLAPYNTEKEIEYFLQTMKKIEGFF